MVENKLQSGYINCMNKRKRLKFSHSKKLTGYFSVAGVP